MIRPFMSSLGRVTTETVRSATNSPARRSIAIETIFLARRSASSRASSLDLPDAAARLRAGPRPTICSMRVRFASSRVMPAVSFELLPDLIDQPIELAATLLDPPLALA